MFAFNFLIILLAFIFSTVSADAIYGGDCTTPDALPGSCMPIMSCKNALEKLRTLQTGRGSQRDREFLAQSQCGNIGDVIYFCCPKEEIQINPDVMTHLGKLDCGGMSGTRVSRGENAGLFDYRWMTLLVSEGRIPYPCGGALIDDRHILTAAHCLKNNPTAVRLGEYNLESSKDCADFGGAEVCLEPAEDVDIEEIFQHPNYVDREIHDDIALIRLKRSITCKNNMHPVCLPITESLQNTAVKHFYIAGWGNTEENIRSNILKFAKVPKKEHDFCLKKLSVDLNEGQICAGGKKWQDTCKGDSGGPIFYPTAYVDGQQRFVQYGIVSAGQKYCGKKNVPGIYTNIVPYMQWLTDHMVVSKSSKENSCYVPEWVFDEYEE